ncbi:Protein of unknown function [Shouchella lonarensis]|uniref:DUF2663 family protein n=1 Tax=Shouchella lonarensis TaxID=1464122 RepID=A0A1G6LFB8_9BACI|nr:Protein of unknown function [Shouchella lonarensis]
MVEERSASLQVLISELIERKEGWERLKQKKQRTVVVMLLSIICLVFLISRTVTLRSLPHEELFASPLRMMLCGVMIGSILLFTSIGKKLDEQEETFESLRQEFIERGEELFPANYTNQEREALLARMKQSYDINLYHYH